MDDNPEENPQNENTDAAEVTADDTDTPGTAGERKVVLNEEPEVYQLDPNSTDVKAVEKTPPGAAPGAKSEAKPCPPPIDQQHLDQIIAETLSIVEHSQKQCNEQKLAIQKMAFMLSCIRESLSLYGCHSETLNKFLVNNDKLQTKWFCQTRKSLKCYGDYTLALKDDPEKVSVDELPLPVPESELKKLAEDAVNNLYSGGTVVQSLRVICKYVYDKQEFRKEAVVKNLEPFESWFMLLEKATNNQDTIRDMLFKVSANVSFLKTGETTDRLILDLSKELESLSAKKAS